MTILSWTKSQPYSTKPYTKNQTKPTRLRVHIAPIFILKYIVIPKNFACLNSGIVILPGPNWEFVWSSHGLYGEQPRLIWWCADPFSCLTQLKLSKVRLCSGWSWVGVVTIIFLWNNTLFQTIKPNHTNQTKPNQLRIRGGWPHLQLEMFNYTRQFCLLKFSHNKAAYI